MGLFFEVVSKCNTCCQSWKEPQKLIERNRDTAFRSIIKLCYKCQPSGEMEFMHTYYYQGNSKGSAYPLAWKQYCLFLSSTYSKLSNITRKKITSMHCNLWGCSISNSVLCPQFFLSQDEQRSCIILYSMRLFGWRDGRNAAFPALKFKMTEG